MELHTPDSPASTVAVSVVVPVFNERECLPDLYARLTKSLSELGVEYEILFVNDGSTDGSEELLNDLAVTDERLAVLHFSRNFGHQPAVGAGLDRATGDAVVVLDGDLQDPPEIIGQLLERWREGFDVVYAVRTKRKESLLRRAGYHVFYRLLRGTSQVDIPLDSGDFCLMDRRALDAMNKLPEKDRFIRGLRSFIGFKQVGVPYERAERQAGRTKYSLIKLTELAITGLVNTGQIPIRAFVGSLFALVLAAFTISVSLGTQWVVAGEPPSGWLIVLAVVLFLFTLQFAAMGFMGLYILKMFAEVKRRPSYILREVRRRGEPAAAALYSRTA
jgi:dolichol-phosphate mannosyltransferase